MKLNSLMTRISPLMAVVLMAGCDNNDSTTPPPSGIEIRTQSVTPSLVKTMPGFDNLKIYPLISSDDTLSGSPAFRYGAQPDGAGMMKDPAGDGYIMITNHEILFSVSRVYLDKNLKPIKGEYIVDAEGGRMRLCSATLTSKEEHGFGPMFLTAGETDGESMIHAIDPLGSVNLKKTNRTVPALGKCSAENAVPLSKNAFPGKTAIFIGEDESSRQGMGQVNLYISNTVGDLQGGKLHMLRRVDKNTVETDMEVGKSYDVEFVQYDDASKTGAELAAETVAKNAIQFARVEDLDFGKGSVDANRKLYFTSTGVSEADRLTPRAGLTMWGRVYELVLDATNPLKGKLTPLVDGNVDPGNSLVNPDNICVTQNFLYIQEDGDSYYVNNKHDGRIWQYNLATKALKPVLEMNHRRNETEFNKKYNPGNETRIGSWEYGAMYDISDLIGKPNTFVVNIHPHTWLDDKFLNADGSGLTTNKEGDQTIIVTGIEK